MPVFWGCLFTHNYPFLMESIKTVLRYLSIGPVEIENVGCCPYPQLEVYDKDAQLALSARNLILAERRGNKLVVPCNGCFNTLNNAHNDLKDHRLRKKINSLLPDGMRYDGELEVIHLLDILNPKLPVIETLIKKPITIEVFGDAGLNLGVFSGDITIIVHGYSEYLPGNTLNAGELIVYGNSGDITGMGARGGKIFVMS